MNLISNQVINKISKFTFDLLPDNKYALAIISGLLMTLSFPPLPFYFLAFIAFIPLMKMLENHKEKIFLPLYICFFIYHGGSNWWISSFQERTDPYLMMAGFAIWLTHAFFFMMPIYFFVYLVKKLQKKNFKLPFDYNYLFPFIWLIYEWTHSLSDLSYPWLTFGNTQILNIYWIQFIDITGIWGSSFLILIANVSIWQMIKNTRSNLYSSKLDFFNSNRISLILIAAILILPYIYGIIVFDKYDYQKNLKENKSINIAVIQPAINPWEKWERDPIAQIQMLKQISDSVINTSNLKNSKTNLVLWPETSIPFVNVEFNSEYDFPFLKYWSAKRQFSLLAGYSDFVIYPQKNLAPATAYPFKDNPNLFYQAFNSAIMLNPSDTNRKKPEVYHKMKLTPFAERLPHAEYLSFAKKWFEWGVGISSWGKGSDQGVLDWKSADNTQNIKIAPIICIESIYPGFVANFSHLGAEIFVVITNDAWYDYTPGPRQHYLIAAVRAIENRRYLARSANTGISGLISPQGISLYETEQYKRTALVFDVPKISEKTFFAEHIDLLPILCSSIIFLIWAYTFIKK